MKFSRISFLSLPNGLRRFSAALRLRKSALSPCPLARCFSMLLFFVSVAVCCFLFVFFFSYGPSVLFCFFYSFIFVLLSRFFVVFLSYIVLLFFSFSVRFFDSLVSLFFIPPCQFLFIFPFSFKFKHIFSYRCRLHELPQSDFSLFVCCYLFPLNLIIAD